MEVRQRKKRMKGRRNTPGPKGLDGGIMMFRVKNRSKTWAEMMRLAGSSRPASMATGHLAQSRKGDRRDKVPHTGTFTCEHVKMMPFIGPTAYKRIFCGN